MGVGGREKGRLPGPKGKREDSPRPPKTTQDKKGKAPRPPGPKREKGKEQPANIEIRFH